LAIVAALLAIATSATANGVFHTLHADLSSVNGEPLQSGWVNDIHMNGNRSAAHEVYHIAGASPNTSYQVVIVFFTGTTTCAGTPALVPTATLMTNGAGAANGTHDFAAGPPSPIMEDSAIWELVDSSGVAYATACHEITIGG
jgi:hypothetical protein